MNRAFLARTATPHRGSNWAAIELQIIRSCADHCMRDVHECTTNTATHRFVNPLIREKPSRSTCTFGSDLDLRSIPKLPTIATKLFQYYNTSHAKLCSKGKVFSHFPLIPCNFRFIGRSLRYCDFELRPESLGAFTPFVLIPAIKTLMGCTTYVKK